MCAVGSSLPRPGKFHGNSFGTAVLKRGGVDATALWYGNKVPEVTHLALRTDCFRLRPQRWFGGTGARLGRGSIRSRPAQGSGARPPRASAGAGHEAM